MPRYRRRGEHRRGPAAPLVFMLLVALFLLFLLNGGRSLLARLPNVTIPITGLPQIQIPTVQIPITLEAGTLIPNTGIEGSPAIEIGKRSKTSGCQVQEPLPDRACTPGGVFSVTADQVCQPGYSSSVRDVSTSLKNQVYTEYGIQSHMSMSGQYEVDHLISLELGGSNDIANLWPEAAAPVPGFHQKDAVENYLHSQVCSGKMSLLEAQRAIATNWLEVYNRMPK
jgi:hypothetical protein